jgi:Tol biopolymer transport system component
MKPGLVVSHYRVLEPLGAGGMGLVFKGEDTRLGRFVAIKFLTSDLENDKAALDRFQREARAASSLNHSGICTVYDIGDFTDERGVLRPFLVMELLEGQTLRERIGGRAIPVDALLDLAVQIADALDAAHARGIIHRDIKPANIFVTTRGQTKILDFGLAKSVSARPIGEMTAATASISADPAAEIVLTSPGSAIGTVAYMSPEQARGDALDVRTDLFSFGAVLYEMSTGTRPFNGATPPVIFDAIFHEVPAPPSASNSAIPQKLDEIVAKALEKDRDLRCQTAAELRADLKRLKREIDSTRVATGTAPAAGTSGANTAKMAAAKTEIAVEVPPRRSLIRILSVMTPLVALGLAAMLAYHLFSHKPHEATIINMTIAPFTTLGNVGNAIISPDGKWVAYTTNDGGDNAIWVKQTATGSSVQIVAPDPRHIGGMTFSPDGNYVEYVRDVKFAHSSLFQVPSLGGESQQLIDGVNSPATFSPDGKRVAFVRSVGGHGGDSGEARSEIVIAGIDGSGDKILAARSGNMRFQNTAPAWSPDGKVIAAAITDSYSDAWETQLETIDASTGRETVLGNHRWCAFSGLAWLPDGDHLAISAAVSGAAVNPQVWMVTYPEGKDQRVTNDLNFYQGMSITADGSTAVTLQVSNSGGLWIAPVHETEISGDAKLIETHKGEEQGTGGVTWLADGRILHTYYLGGVQKLAILSPDSQKEEDFAPRTGMYIESVHACGDGRFAVFTSGDDNGASLWYADFDGGNPRRIFHGDAIEGSVCTPDGKTIVYEDAHTEHGVLWKVSTSGGAPRQMSDEKLGWPAVSPDGKFVAAACCPDTSGMPRLGILPIEGGLITTSYSLPAGFQVSALREFSEIAWTPDGRGVTYVVRQNGVDNIWVQDVDVKAQKSNPPREVTHFTSDQIWSYAWSADGKRLVVSRGRGSSDAVLISHFHQE